MEIFQNCRQNSQSTSHEQVNCRGFLRNKRNSCEIFTYTTLLQIIKEPVRNEISDITKSKSGSWSEWCWVDWVAITGNESDGLLKSTASSEFGNVASREERMGFLKQGSKRAKTCCMNIPSRILWISTFSRVTQPLSLKELSGSSPMNSAPSSMSWNWRKSISILYFPRQCSCIERQRYGRQPWHRRVLRREQTQLARFWAGNSGVMMRVENITRIWLQQIHSWSPPRSRNFRNFENLLLHTYGYFFWRKRVVVVAPPCIPILELVLAIQSAELWRLQAPWNWQYTTKFLCWIRSELLSLVTLRQPKTLQIRGVLPVFWIIKHHFPVLHYIITTTAAAQLLSFSLTRASEWRKRRRRQLDVFKNKVGKNDV